MDFYYLIFSGLFVAAASGLIGSFLVLRKMTLLSDALSHIALPGIALGIIFKFEPLLGGVAFLFLTTILIWQIEEKTKLAVESITGVLFVTALAVGALLIPETELLETFFGSVETISMQELLIQTVASILVIFVTLKYLKPLILTSIAPELGTAAHIKERSMKLLLMVLIAITITIGIGFVGVLLMSALSIIPAATARNLSRNFKGFLITSVVLSIVALESGLVLSKFFAINPGIATVLVSASLFALSLFRK